MADGSAKKKKGEFSEEDACMLLQRYQVEHVLAFLREVAHSPDVKIDWYSLAKKADFEMNNARECQMLWRHIAYGEPLAEEIEEGAQPLDDDSDMEFEMEASPPVSIGFSMEVANCVRVLASGPNDSSMLNGSAFEGDMPNARFSKASSGNRHPASLLQSSNVTGSSVQEQPQAAGPSAEALDANVAADSKVPLRKKRRNWSHEEDSELMVGISKCGVGNWANIVRGECKLDRSASQLSQRWGIMKKKKGTLYSGDCSAQYSEVQLATRRAIDMALKDNVPGGCVTGGNGATATSNRTNLKVSNGGKPATDNTVTPQPQNSEVTNNTSVKPGPMGVSKVPPPKKATTVPNICDPIQAAAFAAGGRIASPSDAATLLKAAQSKNAVHIVGTNPLVKSSTAGSSPLPPNVHFIWTGLAASSASVAAGTGPHHPAGSHLAKGSVAKQAVPPTSVSQLPKATTGPPASLNQSNATPSISASEPHHMEDKTSAEVKVPISDVKPMAVKEEDNAPLSRCSLKASGKNSDLGPVSKDKTEKESEKPADHEKKSTVQESHNLNTSGSEKVSQCSNYTAGQDDDKATGNRVQMMEVSGRVEKPVQADL